MSDLLGRQVTLKLFLISEVQATGWGPTLGEICKETGWGQEEAELITGSLITLGIVSEYKQENFPSLYGLNI